MAHGLAVGIKAVLGGALRTALPAGDGAHPVQAVHHTAGGVGDVVVGVGDLLIGPVAVPFAMEFVATRACSTGARTLLKNVLETMHASDSATCHTKFPKAHCPCIPTSNSIVIDLNKARICAPKIAVISIISSSPQTTLSTTLLATVASCCPQSFSPPPVTK